MKKLIASLLLSFFVFITAYGQVVANEYEKIFSSKNILIDVRTPLEYQYDHLKKAVNIPLNELNTDIKYFAPDKEQSIVVYCASGKRADIAVRELKGLGYTNGVNAGKF